jgi:hypothetical protein
MGEQTSSPSSLRARWLNAPRSNNRERHDPSRGQRLGCGFNDPGFKTPGFEKAQPRPGPTWRCDPTDTSPCETVLFDPVLRLL